MKPQPADMAKLVLFAIAFALAILLGNLAEYLILTE